MTQRLKILNIVGARPNLPKIAPLMHEMQRHPEIEAIRTALGVPCLTLRENTERPITITEGTNLLVGTDPVKIVAAARDTLAGKGKAGRIPPLWDGHAAKRVVDILLKEVPRGNAS
jgi:UDP-N-acetylglucosamine 2-epimerase